MKFECSRLEEALREEEPELLAAAEEHAAGCAECRGELESWRAFTSELSAAARELKHEWESPELWERIDAALPLRPRARRWQWPEWAGWQMMAAAAALVVISVASAWLALRPAGREAHPVQQAVRQASTSIRQAGYASRDFLTEQALEEVRRSETEYARSLDRLAKLAQPALDGQPTQLMASYREKLTLLDAAIADLKENREHNMLNANLNTELLALYQEKQRTLEEVIHYGSLSN